MTIMTTSWNKGSIPGRSRNSSPHHHAVGPNQVPIWCILQTTSMG